MAQTTEYKDIPDLLKQIRSFCNEIERRVEDENYKKSQTEWITAKEFAELTNLSPASVSVYCSNKKFGENQKKIRGKWHIRRTETQYY